MVKTYQRSTQNYWVKPLTFATPLLKNESLTSWLTRAALNQGCSPIVFTSYYWSNYRLWTYDVDKGFNHLDPQIHKDMAILARTDVEKFNSHTLMAFSNNSRIESGKKVALPWTTPLSKRNRYARFGYPYCPECLIDNELPYLNISWRFTWTVCCIQHNRFLINSCPTCHQPYQPQLIEPEQRFINSCYFCKKKINQLLIEEIPSLELHQLQVENLQVWQTNSGVVLNSKVTAEMWFENLIFLINLIRRGLKNPDYMFGKLLRYFEIDVRQIVPPKTGLRFDALPTEERAILLELAYRVLAVDIDTWLQACDELNITQNSFNWSKYSLIPKAFIPIYQQLPVNKNPCKKPQVTKIKPTSPDLVMTMWHRLQRKIEAQESYEKYKTPENNK